MEKCRVYGQLVDDKENPIYGIQLKLIADYSSTFAEDPLLADAVTDKNGKFDLDFPLNSEFMENNKNKGRIIDEKGEPIHGLTVIAEDVDYGKVELNALDLIGSKVKSFLKNESIIPEEGILGNSLDFIKDKFNLLLFFRDDYLGSAVTDENGYYRIIYPQESYREILDKEPDIKIVVKDKLGVFELRETEVHQNITSTFEKINDIIINRAEIEGWQVALNSDSPSRVTSNNNLEILIDNHQAWEKMVEVVDMELWNYLSDLHFKGENKITENKSLNKEIINYNTSEKLPDFNPLLRVENESLQIVRSITPQSLSKKGEAGVLEAYRKAITNAEDFIYLENQYFTNKYIIGALKKALDLKPNLQIIMLINEVPDVPTYRSWQHYGFEFMGLDLQKLIIENPQIGVFAKWSGKFQNGKNKLRNCYIHSKVAIVDDIWATIGTSNLDGSSLSYAEEFGSSELSANHRNMEMNAIMFDTESPRSGNIENFRKILWGEHFGMDITHLERPQEGWLDLWKDKGYHNLSQLEKEEIILHGGILPYSTKNNPKEQIKDLVEQYRRIKARFNR